MTSHNLLKMEISSLSHDGRGIGFIKDSMFGGRGKLAFVSGALPGQKVLCSITKDKKNYLEAQCAEMLDGPPTTAFCPHVSECGGCPLQPMDYSSQLLWKEQLVLDAMARTGNHCNLGGIWQKPLASPQISNFRNKISFAFGHDANGRPALGLRKRGSHEICPVTACALVDEDANLILHAVRQAAASVMASGFLRFLVLRKSVNPDDWKWGWHAICITASGTPDKKVLNIAETLLSACSSLLSFTHEESGSPKYANGEKRIFCLDSSGATSKPALQLPLGGKLFRLDVGNFFQINGPASQKLAHLVKRADVSEAAPGLLDLYCGVGAPGLLLAPNHPNVLGLEADARAIAFARQNAPATGAMCYKAGKVEKLLAKPDFSAKFKFGTILADPPRAGLGAPVVRCILELAPAKIIYVSCDPVTMARDAAILKGQYELAKLESVDLFPHTPRLECCGLWIRKKQAFSVRT